MICVLREIAAKVGSLNRRCRHRQVQRIVRRGLSPAWRSRRWKRSSGRTRSFPVSTTICMLGTVRHVPPEGSTTGLLQVDSLINYKDFKLIFSWPQLCWNIRDINILALYQAHLWVTQCLDTTFI